MFYSLRNDGRTIAAETAFEILDRLRTHIEYGPSSVQDWMNKTRQSHPHINTDNEDAFLAGLIQHGYVLMTENNWQIFGDK